MTKITIERETLEQVITALSFQPYGSTVKHAADVLRAALAAQPAEPVALGDALRWSKATESHGAYVFTPAQLRVFYEYATRAAPPAPAAVPPGYALVPIEPTPEMCKIGGHVMSEWTDDSAPLRERTYAVAFADAYRAMIAAAGDKP